MCEVSRALNIKYTVNTQHVDFYLNGEYLGTYLFSDHIEKSKNRVQINEDVFLLKEIIITSMSLYILLQIPLR